MARAASGWPCAACFVARRDPPLAPASRRGLLDRSLQRLAGACSAVHCGVSLRARTAGRPTVTDPSVRSRRSASPDRRSDAERSRVLVAGQCGFSPRTSSDAVIRRGIGVGRPGSVGRPSPDASVPMGCERPPPPGAGRSRVMPSPNPRLRCDADHERRMPGSAPVTHGRVAWERAFRSIGNSTKLERRSADEACGSYAAVSAGCARCRRAPTPRPKRVEETSWRRSS
jgi:hypothetical protein